MTHYLLEPKRSRKRTNVPDRTPLTKAGRELSAIELADHQVADPHVEACEVCMTFLRQFAGVE